MSNVLEVASYALKQLSSASTMKLQKIVYYSQAYHLVQFGVPLFPERIEAWRNGPVVPDLYKVHAHEFVISNGFFDGHVKGVIPTRSQRVVEHVVGSIGDKTGQELSDLTHEEAPWKNARKGLAADEPSQNEITIDAIREFYSSPSCSNPVFA